MIDLYPWSDADLPVLQRMLGDRDLMVHLGGPETPDQILQRHRRYLELPATGNSRMFAIRLQADSTCVGTIGFWDSQWEGEAVYETGWMVLPEYTGRGIATKAALDVIERARGAGAHRLLHAFPALSNAASNAVCAKSGFENLGEFAIEYPKGHFMMCNDWRLDLEV